MMIAVPNRMILEEELAAERSIGVQRHRHCTIEIFVAQSPDRRRGRRAIALQKFERLALRDARVLPRVPGVDVVDDVRGDADDRLAAADLLCKVDFQWVHGGDVMEGQADLASVVWRLDLPLMCGQ